MAMPNIGMRGAGILPGWSDGPESARQGGRVLREVRPAYDMPVVVMTDYQWIPLWSLLKNGAGVLQETLSIDPRTFGPTVEIESASLLDPCQESHWPWERLTILETP